MLCLPLCYDKLQFHSLPYTYFSRGRRSEANGEMVGAQRIKVSFGGNMPLLPQAKVADTSGKTHVSFNRTQNISDFAYAVAVKLGSFSSF